MEPLLDSIPCTSRHTQGPSAPPVLQSPGPVLDHRTFAHAPDKPPSAFLLALLQEAPHPDQRPRLPEASQPQNPREHRQVERRGACVTHTGATPRSSRACGVTRRVRASVSPSANSGGVAVRTRYSQSLPGGGSHRRRHRYRFKRSRPHLDHPPSLQRPQLPKPQPAPRPGCPASRGSRVLVYWPPGTNMAAPYEPSRARRLSANQRRDVSGSRLLRQGTGQSDHNTEERR